MVSVQKNRNMTVSHPHMLFLFLDGVGLGDHNHQTNPFAVAKMPTLQALLDGLRLTADITPFENRHASLKAIDACLGVTGLPQSASGQAALLTGKNVPAIIGEHYGPKPNPQISRILAENNLFSLLKQNGKRAALLNAFPPRYFENIQRGKSLPGAIAMAALSAGISLKTHNDLLHGAALSADFTGEGWQERLGFSDVKILEPEAAGNRLAALAATYDFALFEYWLTDLVGHRQDMETACQILESFDAVLAGLLAKWNGQNGLIVITSDHGNLEEIHSRRHTSNPVPCLVIGAEAYRRRFLQYISDLTGVTPAILDILNN
jgi:2,3-bisphosphoglycerate-independent phosphoglycerate mutase